jgi:hypothetical protein
MASYDLGIKRPMNAKNLINVTDPDAAVYRIFSKNRFLDLLASSRNGLVNPSKWEDPFENFFLRSQVVGPEGEKISMSSLAEDWYGQCWTCNNDTDAMWRIYSPEKRGIKVKTTVRKLFESFYDEGDIYASLKFFCGKVRYLTEPEITAFMNKVTFQEIAFGGQSTGFAELLCIKREAFQLENEVRLLFQDLDPKRGTAGVAQFDVNMVFDEIVIDPRLPNIDAAKIDAEIRAAGCILPISQSTLYRTPQFKIRLS